jgi:GntR family transcriptional repressor for pyruvate dehydrogenase complex
MARLHRHALQILIAEIVNDQRAAGELLPRETDLVEQFGISRGTVRECIRGLEERGLISVKHGRGATVNPREKWDTLDADVLAALLESPQSTAALADLLECRRLLEIEAAGMAAERADAADVEALAEAYQRMSDTAQRAANNPAAEPLFHEADTAFHRTLIAATKNAALTALAGKIHAAMLTARFALASPQDRGERGLPEHRRILEAVEARDVDAARDAMRTHLDTIAHNLGTYAEAHGELATAAARSGGRR